jgi:hypothetical protein
MDEDTQREVEKMIGLLRDEGCFGPYLILTPWATYRVEDGEVTELDDEPPKVIAVREADL